MSSSAIRESVRGIREEIGHFRRHLDRLFDWWGVEFQDRPTQTVSYPAMNVWQDGESVYVEAELPGIKLEDLEISVTGGTLLTVKGSRAATPPDQAECCGQERAVGSFDRSIELPVSVDASSVEAHLEDGVLSIRLPGSPDSRSTRIAVKAG